MSQNVPAIPVSLQLWFASLTPATQSAEMAVEAMLSASETERLGHLRSAMRRREYLLGRALMRHALSSRFRRAPSDWQVLDQQRAKPVVTNLPGGNYFALTHSKDLVCFALANCPLGVDLEFIATARNYETMAKKFMNEAERTRLAAGGDDQADFFYRAWCAKEACYKLLPADEQAKILFTGIDYGSLCKGDSQRYLCEGRIGEFAFALVTAVRPDKISCDYFDGYQASMGRLELRDRKLKID